MSTVRRDIGWFLAENASIDGGMTWTRAGSTHGGANEARETT